MRPSTIFNWILVKQANPTRKRISFSPIVRIAIKVYRRLGDISMVWSLEEVKNVEDLQLLSGHVHMIIGSNVSKAQVKKKFLFYFPNSGLIVFIVLPGVLFKVIATRNCNRYAHRCDGMGTSSPSCREVGPAEDWLDCSRICPATGTNVRFLLVVI